MANNYYDATGVLVFDGEAIVTPAIRALFRAFELDERYPGGDHCYIERIAESSNTTWEAVLENLREWADDLDIEIHDEAEEGDPTPLLAALAAKFNASGPEFDGVIKEVAESDSCQEADIRLLYELAGFFQDGHNLLAIQYEGCWHSSKARLGEFGGEGEYISRHLCLYSSSSRAILQGEDIDRHLRGNDVASAAQAVLKNVRRLLDGILNDGQREEITRTIADSLSTGKDLQPA